MENYLNYVKEYNQKILLTPIFLIVSCQNGKTMRNNIVIKYPSYVGYSPIDSSFLYDYVVDGTKIINNFDFIKDLNFEESNDNCELAYCIAFIYKNEGIKAYFLGSNNEIYFYEDENIFCSSLENYTSYEIVNFLMKNGKTIDLTLLL